MELLDPTPWAPNLWLRAVGVHLSGISDFAASVMEDGEFFVRATDDRNALVRRLQPSHYDGLTPEQAAPFIEEARAALEVLDGRLREAMEIKKAYARNRRELRNMGKPRFVWAEPIATALEMSPVTVAEWFRVPRKPLSDGGRFTLPPLGKLFAIYGLATGAIDEDAAAMMDTERAMAMLRRRKWTQTGLAHVLRVKQGTMSEHLRGRREDPDQRKKDIRRPRIPAWLALCLVTLDAGYPVPPVFYEWSGNA